MTSLAVVDVQDVGGGDDWRGRGSGSCTCGGTGLHNKANINEFF